MSKIHSSYRAILTMKLQERYFPLLTDESVVTQYSEVRCLGPNAESGVPGIGVHVLLQSLALC